jgi:hypothetical protein
VANCRKYRIDPFSAWPIAESTGLINLLTEIKHNQAEIKLDQDEIKLNQAEIKLNQDEIKLDQAEIKLAVAANTKLVGQVVMDRVEAYINLSSTRSSTPNQESFRAAVAEHYGIEAAQRTSPVPCMVTGRCLDWHDVVAGHIVPRAQHRAARRDILLQNINDPRNGLLWCRPLEAAWSQGLFCFACPGGDCLLWSPLHVNNPVI